MQLREPERPTEGSERRLDRLRDRQRIRRRWVLQGFMVVSAILCAWSVLLFVGSPVREEEGEVAVNTARPILNELLPNEPLEESPRESLTLEEEPKEEPSFDVEALEDELEAIVGEQEGVYGISVLEPDSRARVSLRGDEEFVAASIGKLPPFAALYAAAARGKIDLDEEISIRTGDVQSYGSGGLHGFGVGYSLSLRECAYRLVNHSDNTAWSMLDRRLGKGEIGAELKSMGIQDSSYYGHLSGYYTTPNDVLLLLEQISDPHFTDEYLSVEMLEVMTETSVEDRIPEKLPEDVRVAHKTGSYEGNFGDAGVVFYRDSQGEARRYYLTVLSEGTGEYQARDVIQEISLAVYKAISGVAVGPDWSRGSVRQEESAPVTPPQPAPAENTGKPAENVQPTIQPSPTEKPLPQRPPESRYNAVPDSRPTPPPYPAAKQPAKPAPPPYPPVRESAYPRQSAPTYYQKEPGYWEEAYWEGW